MARDKFHEEVKTALQGEGWAITEDPLYLKVGRIPVHIDLGAEKLIGAEKEGEKIAVEVKTFGNTSFIRACWDFVFDAENGQIWVLTKPFFRFVVVLRGEKMVK